MSQNDTDFIGSGEEEYEVESIAAHRKTQKRVGVDYLIKWKGYDKSDNTWENESNVHAPALIEAYWAIRGGRQGLEAARLGKKKQKKQQQRQRLQRRQQSTARRVRGMTTSEEPEDLSDSSIDDISSHSSSTKRDVTLLHESSKKRARILPSEEIEEDKEQDRTGEDKMENDDEEKDKVEESIKEKEDRTQPVTSLDPILIPKIPKEVNMDDIIFDSNYPTDGDSIDWEEEVESVEYIVRDPDDTTTVYVVLRWKNGDVSMHEKSVIHKKCPLLLLKYYEERVTFPE